jgi:hypothetical protein
VQKWQLLWFLVAFGSTGLFYEKEGNSFPKRQVLQELLHDVATFVSVLIIKYFKSWLN